MAWSKDGKQCHEVAKIRWELVPYTRGRGLDLGCGPEKGFPHFRGIDNNKDAALFNIPASAADLIYPTCEKLEDFASASQDFVFSSHLLEHIEDHVKALREWWRVLKPGGHLCLYLPHKSLYPRRKDDGEAKKWLDANKREDEKLAEAEWRLVELRRSNGVTKIGDLYAGTHWANPDHQHDFDPQDIIDAMKFIGGWDLLENQERDGDDEYSFFQVYKKFSDPKIHKFSCNDSKPAKTCAIVRYGAWGDVIQMSSILPALKEDGYHITLYTVPRAWEAVKHESLIDRVVLQDTEQVPNAWLGDFWASLRKKYDRFINLSESVEGSMLAMPDRIHAQWPKEARDRYMNMNYIEFTHQIAGVKFEKPLMRFVMSEDEKKWAKSEKAKLGAEPLIMWVLAGSAVHKVWEGIDVVLARIMLTWPHAKVITVGDERCKQMIEQPWEKEPRIIRRSGVWSIRETMTMAHYCDLVVGPETGVMSSVAMAPMPKIVLLSHSSPENLTRGWIATHSVHSLKTPCWPCHKLIYNFDQCVRDERTGTAQCQADIHPDQVWEPMCEALATAHVEAA